MMPPRQRLPEHRLPAGHRGHSRFPQFDVDRIRADDDARDVTVDHTAVGKIAFLFRIRLGRGSGYLASVAAPSAAYLVSNSISAPFGEFMHVGPRRAATGFIDRVKALATSDSKKIFPRFSQKPRPN
jgi:hypothetical protein